MNRNVDDMLDRPEDIALYSGDWLLWWGLEKEKRSSQKDSIHKLTVDVTSPTKLTLRYESTTVALALKERHGLGFSYTALESNEKNESELVRIITENDYFGLMPGGGTYLIIGRRQPRFRSMGWARPKFERNCTSHKWKPFLATNCNWSLLDVVLHTESEERTIQSPLRSTSVRFGQVYKDIISMDIVLENTIHAHFQVIHDTDLVVRPLCVDTKMMHDSDDGVHSFESAVSNILDQVHRMAHADEKITLSGPYGKLVLMEGSKVFEIRSKRGDYERIAANETQLFGFPDEEATGDY